MNRNSLASLLVGVLAVLAGLYTFTYFRSDKCVDAGGRWNDTTRLCELPASVSAAAASPTPAMYLISIVVGVMVGLMLWRVFRLSKGEGPARR